MATLAEAPARAPRWRAFVATALGSVEGRVGFAILAIFLFMVAFGPIVAPHNPTEIGVGLPDASPGGTTVLGTDHLGRDIMSRILHGARPVVGLPLAATAIAFLVGGLLGMLAGYRGGLFDGIFSRFVDIMVSIPPLLVVLVIIAAFGSSNWVIVVSVALVYSPRVARILRGAVQGVAGQEYIQAAQARGERSLPIVIREVLPNIAPTVLVEFAIRLTFVIIFIATVNFLGIGTKPPSPNWGVMIAESRPTIITNPLATIAPTIAIGLLCVSIGLVADAMTRRLGLDRRSSQFLR
jgi:peptide/nickel transport system permease protein